MASAEEQTILLVEDDILVRRVVSRILRHGGFEALMVNEGQQAIPMESDFKGTIDMLCQML